MLCWTETRNNKKVAAAQNRGIGIVSILIKISVPEFMSIVDSDLIPVMLKDYFIHKQNSCFVIVLAIVITMTTDNIAISDFIEIHH